MGKNSYREQNKPSFASTYNGVAGSSSNVVYPIVYTGKIEIMSVICDHNGLPQTIKRQDETIQTMAESGYEHYETIPIGNSQVVLRFRRFAKC